MRQDSRVTNHLISAGEDHDEIDILVQKRRNKQAALRFFRKLFRKSSIKPLKVVTDKLRSYQAALKEISPETPHCTEQYQNNRAELSHQPTRQRERKMRRFKSMHQSQRFLSFHGLVNNLFRHDRHLMSAKNYRHFEIVHSKHGSGIPVPSGWARCDSRLEIARITTYAT